MAEEAGGGERAASFADLQVGACDPLSLGPGAESGTCEARAAALHVQSILEAGRCAEQMTPVLLQKEPQRESGRLGHEHGLMRAPPTII